LGRALRRDHDLYRRPVGILDPEPLLVGEGVGLRHFRADPIEMAPKRIEIFGVEREAQVLQLLASRGAIDRAPAVRVTEGAKVDALVRAPHVQAERTVELSRRAEVRYGEHEALKRVNRGHAGAARRSGSSFHGLSSRHARSARVAGSMSPIMTAFRTGRN